MPLSQHIVENAAMHIRQAEVPALESERQTLVIQPEQMENRRLQVVNVLRPLDSS